MTASSSSATSAAPIPLNRCSPLASSVDRPVCVPSTGKPKPRPAGRSVRRSRPAQGSAPRSSTACRARRLCVRGAMRGRTGRADLRLFRLWSRPSPSLRAAGLVGTRSPATPTARRPGATSHVHPGDQGSRRYGRADGEDDVLDHRVEGCPITCAPQTGGSAAARGETWPISRGVSRRSQGCRARAGASKPAARRGLR
jgi:hypothetical protein